MPCTTVESQVTSNVTVTYLLQMREELVLAVDTKVIQSLRLRLTKLLHKSQKMTAAQVVIAMPW